MFLNTRAVTIGISKGDSSCHIPKVSHNRGRAILDQTEGFCVLLKVSSINLCRPFLCSARQKTEIVLKAKLHKQPSMWNSMLNKTKDSAFLLLRNADAQLGQVTMDRGVHTLVYICISCKVNMFNICSSSIMQLLQSCFIFFFFYFTYNGRSPAVSNNLSFILCITLGL